MAWNPSDARRRNALAISAAEKIAFESRMDPLVRDAAGLFDADAVFEGGGVLGTAFLGAARCCAELGIRWHGLAGTSAGAVIATLLAADLAIDQLEYEIGNVDFRDFLKRKTSRHIFNGDPGNDLEHPVQLLTNLGILGEIGEYSTEPFQQWLGDVLFRTGIASFGEAWDQNPRAPKDRQLKVIVSDLTRGEMLVLPDDLESPPEKHYRLALTPKQRSYRVSDAVRLSMSIPFFFEPGKLERLGGTSVIVDGGVLSNFPLWIFDKDTPEWPTFGFRLVDRADHPPAIDNVNALLAAMLKSMMLSSDRRHLSPRHQGRTIDLDLTGLNLTATSFALSNDQKDQLYIAGYRSAKKFFLEEWDWKKHVKLRTGLAI